VKRGMKEKETRRTTHKVVLKKSLASKLKHAHDDVHLYMCLCVGGGDKMVNIE
jgi:hypothetical protein